MRIPIVALIGKPNVGKSTLFNKLVRKRISIIDNIPGITRDRIYGTVEHKNYKFRLIDTGGITTTEDAFNKDIRMQAEIAINEADIILFLVDGKTGIDSDDNLVSDILRKSNKEVILLVNKIDSKEADEFKYDYYSLGFKNTMFISSEHGRGLYEVLDKITEDLDFEEDEEENTALKISVIGRPNVGKSSVVNCILDEERAIVSDVSGTTRDSIDTLFTYNDKDYIIIDTAGIKKHGRIYENIERYSILRSFKAIDRCDVCIVILNAEEGIIEMDKHIAGYALDNGKAIILAVNKWDKSNKSIKEFEEDIRESFKFIPFAPIVYISALKNKGIDKIIPLVERINENWTKEIKTSLINNIINEAVVLNSPPSYKSRTLKIYFVSQIDNKPPKFLFQVNDKRLIHFSYERYLENKIREYIDYEGTPIILSFKNRGEK